MFFILKINLIFTCPNSPNRPNRPNRFNSPNRPNSPTCWLTPAEISDKVKFGES